jgi:copper(I)-binding protein
MAAAAAVLALALSACGSSSSSAADVVARIGALEIVHPFLPKPASASVAAVYLTVRNTGDRADELVSVSTSLTSMAMLMAEDSHGSAETMAPLNDLRVPAHGDAALRPGQDHVMLENPRAQLRVGQHVKITLRFEHAGAVTISVPVVPLTALLNDDGAGGSTGSSGSMGHMKGMS